MLYRVGGKIKSKKPHACAGNDWTVVRTGADVKLKCDKCGRMIFLSHEAVAKMAASYRAGDEQ